MPKGETCKTAQTSSAPIDPTPGVRVFAAWKQQPSYCTQGSVWSSHTFVCEGKEDPWLGRTTLEDVLVFLLSALLQRQEAIFFLFISWSCCWQTLRGVHRESGARRHQTSDFCHWVSVLQHRLQQRPAGRAHLLNKARFRSSESHHSFIQCFLLKIASTFLCSNLSPSPTGLF